MLGHFAIADHNLKLKVVMLLRNLQAGSDHTFSKGTRMVVLQMIDKVIACEIAVGTRRAETLFLPRIADRQMSFPSPSLDDS